MFCSQLCDVLVVTCGFRLRCDRNICNLMTQEKLFVRTLSSVLSHILILRWLQCNGMERNTVPNLCIPSPDVKSSSLECVLGPVHKFKGLHKFLGAWSVFVHLSREIVQFKHC